MRSYRENLPQLDGGLFLTDGGIETSLIFNDGLELPDFAAFDLLRRPGGEQALEKYFRAYARIAARHGAGLILESATWRASADWGARLGYSARELGEINRRAIALLEGIRDELSDTGTVTVISGCVGPRGDGYQPGRTMSVDQAQRYHGIQVGTFADSAADMVSAITMNTVEEAVGIARAAAEHNMPVAVSFTVETDGRLPSGETLEHAITRTDAETDAYAAYYMINCAHPKHFMHVLEGGAWLERVRGIRANASELSHAELDAATTLDDGDPRSFGRHYRKLHELLPNLSVVGGCCGTDHRHVKSICRSLWPLMEAA